MYDWRQGIKGTLDDVHLEVLKISKHWERAVFERCPLVLGALLHGPPLPRETQTIGPTGPASKLLTRRMRTECSHNHSAFSAQVCMLPSYSALCTFSWRSSVV